MDTWLGFVDAVDQPKKANEIENLIRIPQVRQPDSYSCGIACLQSVLQYYGMEVDYTELENKANADPRTGTDHRDILKFLKKIKGLEVELQKGMLISDLFKFIDEGIPVIVVLQAWSDKPKDYSTSWDSGHYSVVIGYDTNNIYFMDPSTLGHYAYIPTSEFVKRWHDQDMDIKLRQSGIIIHGTKQYDADAIEKIQ